MSFLTKIPRHAWLVIGLSFLAWTPLLTPAYFLKAHDARHSLFYVVEFTQTLQDGYLWPRWAPDFAFGYGYPLFNIYAPLAIYAASLLHLSGLSVSTAVKTMYAVATIAGGLGMYGFTRRLFGSQAALLAATCYTYAPFHFVDIYIRSAYAEFVALALVPYLFWAFTALIAAPTPRRLALAALCYGLLALTHHTSLFTFTPFLMIYILYLIITQIKAQKPRPADSLPLFLYPLGSGLLGAALASIYLLPVIAETKYIKVEQWTSGSYSYLDHFVYFSQLLLPTWGYGYAGVGLQDDFSYQLGLVIVILNLFALIKLSHYRFPHRGTALFFVISTGVLIWLMSPLAVGVWQIIPLATLVQFPWRLLGVTAFTMSMVAGSLLATHPSTDTLTVSPKSLYLLLLVLIISSHRYTLPQYTDIPEAAETPLAVINWDRGSIGDRVGMVAVTQQQPTTSPMEAQYVAHEPLQVAGIITGTGQITTLHHGGSSDRVQVVAANPVSVQFYTYDYPGWQVRLNAQLIPHRADPPFGLITVDLPPGTHDLYLVMGSTPPRTFGAFLSGAAMLLIGILLMPRSKPSQR